MRAIKLMADYASHPLWEASPDAVGNIDPAVLPVSDALKNRLRAWAESFDRTLNDDDPLASGFASADEAEGFARDGQDLARDLQAELGPEYRVIAQI
jgi:hypothetical protein